jgi:LPXTG-motif cell wall-anchored protein
LYDLISKETYGATVTLTYSATVTGLQVGNTIVSSNGGDTSNEVKLYTGSITITKKAEGSADAKLPGAGFKVYNTEKNKWATFDDNQLTGWVDNIGAATEVTTDTEGKVTVTGLNKGTYEFHEVTAPEGYSINATPTTVKLGEDISEEKPASAPFSEDGTMEDTQLKALPSTGGIGTTIFTVAGCLIMIAAAGMYFASRRRNAK